MSLLTIGVSHRSASIELVERVAAGIGSADDLRGAVSGQEDVSEVVVLATCNRVEVYTEADTFHGALAQVSGLLARAADLPLDDLAEHFYVHYEDRAVSHLFSLACGLDSMAVGESQILGQLRQALARSQDAGDAAGGLNPLFQQALRLGKRAHSETSIDQVSQSLVSLALRRAADRVPDLSTARAVVVGAGSMAGLATATLRRAGVADLVVVNRTMERADRLAESYAARSAHWAALPEVIAGADLVLACTGAQDLVIGADQLIDVDSRRERPLVLIDLAMPHDIDPAVADLPGVDLIGLAQLQEESQSSENPATADVVDHVRDLVAGEVAEYLASRRANRVGPTVAALRARANQVVDAELERLERKAPDLDPTQAAEVRRTVQRVVDKLLHTPTVRVREMVGQGLGEQGSEDYAGVLRELFDLDARDVAAVATPPQATGEIP